MGVDRVPQGRLNARMSYVSNHIHLVFSTKERRKLITPALRERLWPFMGGIARQNKMKAICGIEFSRPFGTRFVPTCSRQ